MRSSHIPILLLLVCISLAFVARHARREQQAPPPPPPTTPIYIWPLPHSLSRGTQLRHVNYNVSFSCHPPFPDLTAAIRRFKDVTFQHRAVGDSGVSAVAVVEVRVSDINAALQMGVDESYTLDIPDGNNVHHSTVLIRATTYYGALHALETLSQLISFNFTTSTYHIQHTPWSIQDQPRYPHRGLMVDTSRHYQTMAVLRQVIDSMAYSKYNVFHWHLSDTQSFPYQSDVLPLLANAAYSADERYCTADVVNIVEYARQRGVRVMMEFDIPGHAASWCVGYPEVCPSPDCPTPLDPSSPATFDVMERLFTELTGAQSGKGLLPETLFHLGGDEVNRSCWTQVEHVSQWLLDNNMTDKDAYHYTVDRAQDIIFKHGRTPVGWDEIYQNFGTAIDKRTIIHVWNDETLVHNITRDGYRVLYSPDDWPAWYMDSLYSLWTDMYGMDPERWISDPEQAALVIGGESCMWGEVVDAGSIMRTIWPRAAAVGERLWSHKSVNDTAAAEPRYAYFRCLLNRRGIDAGPYNSQEAGLAPDGPGSCLQQ